MSSICDFLSSLHRVTRRSRCSPHQSNMPGRFLSVFINQLRATWHSTELLTCSLCLTDTEQRTIHNCTTHPRSAACKSPVNPDNSLRKRIMDAHSRKRHHMIDDGTIEGEIGRWKRAIKQTKEMWNIKMRFWTLWAWEAQTVRSTNIWTIWKH